MKRRIGKLTTKFSMATLLATDNYFTGCCDTMSSSPPVKISLQKPRFRVDLFWLNAP